MDLVKNWDWEQKPVSCSEIIEILLWQSLKKLNHTLYSQPFSSKQKTSASVPQSSHFLFNSSSPATVQKPVKFISHICAFSRGALNVRSTRSHPTLAPRPQIWLMKFTGFCAVAEERELDRERGFRDKSWCLLLTREWLGTTIGMYI